MLELLWSNLYVAVSRSRQDLCLKHQCEIMNRFHLEEGQMKTTCLFLSTNSDAFIFCLIRIFIGPRRAAKVLFGWFFFFFLLYNGLARNNKLLSIFCFFIPLLHTGFSYISVKCYFLVIVISVIAVVQVYLESHCFLGTKGSSINGLPKVYKEFGKRKQFICSSYKNAHVNILVNYFLCIPNH